MRVRLRVLHADGDAPHHRGAEVLSPLHVRCPAGDDGGNNTTP